MNAIIGMATIGAKEPNLEGKDYAINKISEASTHLLGVINDILDMSKIEANKFNLTTAEFEFEQMIRSIVDIISFRLDEKKQKLTVNIDSTIPTFLIGDDQRISQVIVNLLTNAVKFSPEKGIIHLEAELKEEKDGICTVLVSVSDNGIGISKEQQERLFTAFEQAESSTTRKYGGTGLGLVISKSIVEAMGGTIWIDSELDKGAKFSFTANFERGKDAAHIAKEELSNKRLLVVNESADILDLFKDATNQLGVNCDMVTSPKEALSTIDRNGSYDLYFVDLDMLEMNGIEFAKILNQRGDNNTVVIITTVRGWAEVQDAAIKIGVTRFITKPLFISSIIDCIDECIGDCANSNKCNPTRDFSGHHILLAEDVDINREIVLSLLAPSNLEVDCAENGQKAVEMFLANPDKYDLILMDIQMPEMDGYEATRTIRESDVPRAKEIQIIAMTANVFKEDVEKCLEAGMNGHVGKPIDFDVVMSILEKNIK
jgi:CheY-like chemotaxis protein/two-component sensor histidine kinase